MGAFDVRSLRRHALSVDERARRLAAAGNNVWRLPADDVELDLFSDVPERSFVTADSGDPATAIAALYGVDNVVAMQHGRSAEYALATTLAARTAPKPLAVVTTGLFITTERAFRVAGATIELAPRARDGSSDPDLAWLEARIARGGLDVVCLEPACGALAGWPLTSDAVAAVGRLCRNAGVMVVLDATRVLANAAALGQPVLATARAMCAEADAITASCSKELLVAAGGFVASKDPELSRACWGLAWNLGCHLAPVQLAHELAAGAAALAADQSCIARRTARLGELAARTGGAMGAHAVFVRLDAVVERDRPHHAIALEGALYEATGVRARIANAPLLDTYLLRLTWPLGAVVEPADVDRIHAAVEQLVRGLPAPDLVPIVVPGEVPLFRAYRRAASH